MLLLFSMPHRLLWLCQLWLLLKFFKLPHWLWLLLYILHVVVVRFVVVRFVIVVMPVWDVLFLRVQLLGQSIDGFLLFIVGF